MIAPAVSAVDIACQCEVRAQQSNSSPVCTRMDVDVEYNKFMAKYRLHYRSKEKVQIFFPLDSWPRHLVKILFKLHISGSSGSSETGHTARFKIVMFLFCNGLCDSISYIKVFQPGLHAYYLQELTNSLQYVKNIISTNGIYYLI